MYMQQGYGVVDAGQSSQAEPPFVADASEPAAQGDDEQSAAEESKAAELVGVRKIYVAIGVGIIVACCVAALAVGRVPSVATALTVVTMVGAAVLSFAPELRFRRPLLGRAVLATCGALLVLIVQPVTLLSSLW